MTVLAISSPLPQFFDLDGKPLTNGRVYIGTPFENPETDRVPVYWDADGTQPAAQPLATKNGYLMRAGKAAPLFAPEDYSITVRNSKNQLVLSIASAAKASAAAQIVADLASTASASKGAGMVGFLYALAYAPGTIGRWLKDLALGTGASFIGWTRTGVGAVLRTLAQMLTESALTPEQFGAAADGVTDDAPAVIKMVAHLMLNGGKAKFNAGKTYYLNDEIFITPTQPVSWKISGWGARIINGPAVTGFTFNINDRFNEFRGVMEGLYIDHRGNTTVSGCFELKKANFVAIRDNVLEMHSVKPTYNWLHLDTGNPGPGEDDFNCFWTEITGNSTRKRSGAEPGTIPVAIRLTGASNATIITKNTISNCDIGVLIEPAGTTKTLANGVVITKNAFETITTTAVRVQMTPGYLGITGLRYVFNRIEACPSVFDIITGGAAALVHQQPPLVMGNYAAVPPSVTTWVNNPTGYPVTTWETRYPGYGPTVENDWWTNSGTTLRFATGYQFNLKDAAGSFDWNRGRLVFGNYNIWVNPGTGKLMINGSTPANAADGIIVGTQS